MSRLALQLLKILTLPVSIVLLVGCGFHLRGNEHICPEFKALQVLSNDLSDTTLQQIVMQSLLRRQVNVINSTSDVIPYAVLNITSSVFEEQNLAFNSFDEARVSKLTLKVSYQIQSKEGDIIKPNSTIEVEQEYFINNNEVLQHEHHKNLIQTDLMQELAQQLVWQLY